MQLDYLRKSFTFALLVEINLRLLRRSPGGGSRTSPPLLVRAIGPLHQIMPPIVAFILLPGGATPILFHY